MTVPVARLPGRNAGNRILPFRRPVPTGGLIRNPKFPSWKPPVPEPLPPAPLLSAKDLLWGAGVVLAGLAARAAQLWGWLSGRPLLAVPADIEQGGFVTGTVPPKGNTATGRLTATRTAGSHGYSAAAACNSWVDVQVGANTVMNEPDVVQITFTPEKGPCGVTNLLFTIKTSTGSTYFKSVGTTTYGYRNITWMLLFNWTGPGGVPFLPDVAAIPLPAGWKPPQVLPAPPMVFPFEIGRPDPFAPLEPEAEPVAVPIAPGPMPPAVPGVAVPNPVYAPVGVPGSMPIRDGSVVAPRPAPVPTTPADVVFPVPGGKPVGGPAQSPRQDLVGIAQEVGKIERKMEGLLNPQGDGNPLPEWLDRLDDFWDAFQKINDLLTSMGAAGKYTLTEPCDPDEDGVLAKREIPFAGATGPLGVIENKIDALAGLMQAAKDLRQPVCPPAKATGQLVSIRFASVVVPAGDKNRLQKLFRYRDQSGAPLVDHHDHWKNFTWTSGPVLVRSTGLPWGKPTVWAASVSEGKRVLNHAAAVAGVGLDDPRHKWDIRFVSDPRYGRSELLEVKRLNLDLRAITKRPGPDGPIWVVAE